jgi:hypothetical protein
MSTHTPLPPAAGQPVEQDPKQTRAAAAAVANYLLSVRAR